MLTIVTILGVLRGMEYSFRTQVELVQQSTVVKTAIRRTPDGSNADDRDLSRRTLRVRVARRMEARPRLLHE